MEDEKAKYIKEYNMSTEPKKAPELSGEKLPGKFNGEILPSTAEADAMLQNISAELGMEIEPKIDQSAIERVKNSLDRANLVEALENGAELSESDRERLGGMIKERGWFGMFKDLKAGDSMAYFSSPGGEFSVKNLNTLFGEQVTDSVIDSRKKILNELMTQSGHEALSEDYRSASFKLSKTGETTPEEDMNAISSALNERMKVVINSAIESQLSEGGTDTGKFTRMKELLEPDGEGYRINFGTSVVGDAQSETDKSNIIQVLAECAQTAQLSRRLSKDSYGSAYDRESVVDEIKGENGINELGDKLLEKSITDKIGIKYNIFTEKDGKRVMNRDLLRLTRKGEFKPEDSDADTFKMVQQYVRRINLVDLVKPFTAKEAVGGEISERIDKMSKFVEKNEAGKYVLKADLSQADREQLSAELKTDQKDGTYDAPEFFHKKASELKDCVYINIDVLDLGVDLLLEYEQLIQEVGEDETKLREASLTAGDKITENMRAVRAKALEVFKKYFPDADPIDRVGGDEIALAIEDKGDQKVFEEFMLALQNETGTRVVKTVVGGSERHSEDDKNDELLSDHLTAIKRAENGSEMCKKIEKKMRLAEMILEQVKGISSSDEDGLNAELSRMEIKHFKNIAVTEDQSGKLKVICRLEKGGIGELDIKEVENWIGQAIATVSGKFGA